MPDWYLLSDVNGTVREQVQSDGDPTSPGGGYAGRGLNAKKLSRAGNLSEEQYIDGQGWRPDVEKMRARALLTVDAYRDEFERTSLSSRLTHQRKLNEAMSLLANPDLSPAELPWLTAEADATGKTVAEVGQGVREAAQASEAALAQFEAAAIAGKAAIRAATTAPQIRDALASVKATP
jgi:hypothetical protein